MVRTSGDGLRAQGAILLVSCYDLGHQPQALASSLGFLEYAGFAPAAIDSAVERMDPERIRSARFVGISVPMHTALRLGVNVARYVRELNPDCHICFFGDYALLHAGALLQRLADSVLGGEFEEQLVELIQALDQHTSRFIDGVARPGDAPRPILRRIASRTPSRAALPPLDRYAHLLHRGSMHLSAHVQASRGCLHHCRHCPIPAVYGGRLFTVEKGRVLEDIRSQVRAGATHVTFGDPDFLNGPSHSLRIVRAMHEEFPHLTFDFTAKVEHILSRRGLMPELADLGAIFMVSAVECLNDHVLSILEKGHTRADVLEAIVVLRDAGIALRPSLLPFTPWSTIEDYVDLLDFAERERLIDAIDPVQFSVRLLLPPGSLLLTSPDLVPHVGVLDDEALSYTWIHPDPRMDALHKEVAAAVEEAGTREEDPYVTFYRIRLLAVLAAKEALAKRRRPPRLTESWFC